MTNSMIRLRCPGTIGKLAIALLCLSSATAAVAQIYDPPTQRLPATVQNWSSNNQFRHLSRQPIIHAPSSLQADNYAPSAGEATLANETIYPQALEHSIQDDYSAFVAQERPSDARDGFFQMASFTGTWMPAIDSDDFGQSDLEAYSVFALPAPTADSPLLFTPLFAARYLDGPTTPDMPSRVYDASLQIRWLPKLSDRFRLDLAFEPGLHGDFEKSDDDALRFPGHGLGIFEWAPGKKLVLGVLYLDREDINYLPAGGLILNPYDGLQLDLIFPKPKIAWRTSCEGCVEVWQYIAAEFGGGPYSIQRANGAQDVVIQTDYRLLYGIERKRIGGLKSRIEIGYVMGRELDYVSNTTDYKPSDTVIVRAGVAY